MLKQTIALVDDDRNILTSLSIALEKEGFKVQTYIDGESALIGLTRIPPDLAVIEATIGFTIALVALDNAGVVSGHRHYFAYALIGILLVMLLFNLTSGAGLSTLSIVGLIILTLAYMPLASSETKSVNFRPVMAIAFGLIHGFGFASALAEIGLSGAQLWPALLGFNLGIEVGQLIIIVGLWLALKQLNEKNRLLQPRLVVDLVSASLCGLGFYWFIGRSYGII